MEARKDLGFIPIGVFIGASLSKAYMWPGLSYFGSKMVFMFLGLILGLIMAKISDKSF